MLRPHRVYNVVPSLPASLAALEPLSRNLWWSWNPDAIELFLRLDRDLWEQYRHNPIRLLGAVRQERLEHLAQDDGFIAHLERVWAAFQAYVDNKDTWYANHCRSENLSVAYFSAEFGITECVPNYSGGLGILSGDHLKSASDLGLPLVGVGLLYQQGYFRQYLNVDGWQQESYPINDFYTMPMSLVQGEDGVPIHIQVDYPGRAVTAQVWLVEVGRISLYLLDTNISENSADDRGITSQLYGGYDDMRIQQEIMLGIGGIRTLWAMGMEPNVFHMNEGHSSFLALERVRRLIQEKGLDFEAARLATRAGNVFTTHTPVPAGIDLFPPNMMDQYFSYYWSQLGLDRQAFLYLGQRGNTGGDRFSMAVLALELADHVNGVSKIHSQVARDMWKVLWPQTPKREVPISAITNGVHAPSWVSHDMGDLYLRYLGPGWRERPWDKSVWLRVDSIPDAELWRTHERRRERLVSTARGRLVDQLVSKGASTQEIGDARDALDPEVLTIGFARRFATYKRATLLFRDPERLARILNDPERPVQIIFAGKAHPHDNPGKELIRQIVHYSRQPEFQGHVVFIENYDMNLARYLLQGVDIWLNTPRSGLEASGTSGMKAAMNGALNCSAYDGWWCEGYSNGAGWSIGRGEKYDDPNYGDEVEARALYDILEKDVVPRFYSRGHDGLPHNWISMMKSSIGSIAPQFSSHRMVEQYCSEMYEPAFERHHQLVENDYQVVKELASWVGKIKAHWGELSVVSVESSADDSMSVGEDIEIKTTIRLGALDPKDIQVLVYHGIVDETGTLGDYEIADMDGVCEVDGSQCAYRGTISNHHSGRHGYTVCLRPHHPEYGEVSLPGYVLWSD